MAVTKSIELRTEIPGPRSRDPRAETRVIADPLSVYLPIVAAEGRGAALTDVDGNTFIDFTGGVGCLNIGPRTRGSSRPRRNSSPASATRTSIVPYELYVTLAERLAS